MLPSKLKWLAFDFALFCSCLTGGLETSRCQYLVKFCLGTAFPNIHFKTSAFLQHWLTLQSLAGECTTAAGQPCTGWQPAHSHCCHLSFRTSTWSQWGDHWPTWPHSAYSALAKVNTSDEGRKILVIANCKRLYMTGDEGHGVKLPLRISMHLWEGDKVSIPWNRLDLP